MSAETYSADELVIGSSPISLLEAMHLAEIGKRVLLVERHDSLGGAWRVHDCLGLEAVEISPHLLVADPVVYRIIEQKFQLDLEPVIPPPQYCYWDDDHFDGRYPIQNQLAEHLRDEVRAAKHSHRERLFLPIEAAIGVKKFWSKRNLPVHYPKGGLAHLLGNAERILEDLGVEVRTGVEVERFDWRRQTGRFEVATSAGPVDTGRIALPRIFDIEGLSYDGRPITPYFSDNHSSHLALKLRTEQSGQLPFLKVGGSPYFEFINDITPYCVGRLRLDERIVACRCVRSLTFDHDQIDDYVDHLRELDYLPAGDRLVDYRLTEVTDRVLAHYMQPRLSRLFGDRLRFLGAGELDITGSIRRFNDERWRFV